MGNGHVRFSGASGDYASVPDGSWFPTGDLTYELDLELADWSNPSTTYLLNKFGTSGEYTFRERFYINASNFQLLPQLSEDGTTIQSSLNLFTPAPSGGERHRVRVEIDIDKAGDLFGEMFLDDVSKKTSTIVGAALSGLHDSSAELGIMGRSAGANTEGKLFRARIWAGVGTSGDPVLDADFSSLTQAEIDAGSFVCATAQTVTINGTGWTAEPGTTPTMMVLGM